MDIEFNYMDEFVVTGRGRAVVGLLSQEMIDVWPLVGKTVRVDGRSHIVKGVEMAGDSLRTGKPISILIGEPSPPHRP